MKLSDYVVMSDIDGTLIHQDGTIPTRNREAIARFQAKGGRFGIATGRSPMWTANFARQVGVNLPCVCFNGGSLYDFERDVSLMEEPLPDTAKAYAEILREIPFPVGMIAMTRDSYKNISEEHALVEELLRRRQVAYTATVDWREITEPWYKILLVLPDGRYGDTMAFLEAQKSRFTGVRFTTTTYSLVEMLPAHITKGYALEILMAQMGLRREQLACIGDFYNDFEMIQLAGIGAATAEAPEEIRAAADFITGSYKQGAVADLIEYLEAHCD
jgi:Cof subfamily protein (haloacid dehalogenase superfamily)